MRTSTVNISFQQDLLKEIDRWAQREFRSRSEIIREAARNYIRSRESWKEIFAFGKGQARRLRLKGGDVASAISSYRKRKKVSP